MKRLGNRDAALEFATPMIGRHGRPDAQRELVVPSIVRQPRRWRMATAFVALVASGLGREVAATGTRDFHGCTLGFVGTIRKRADNVRRLQNRCENGYGELLSLLSPFTRLSGVNTREFARARIHG